MKQPSLPLLVQHSLLQRRGGTSRVARMLHDAAREQGLQTSYSFEVAETRQGETQQLANPWQAQLIEAAQSGAIIHLHASMDWGALLRLLPSGTRLMVTLHDASLLTGGCPQPLGCAFFAAGCDVDQCPRDFPDVASRRRKQAELLRSLSPVLVCPSRWMKDLVAVAMPDIKVQVVPNGVDWPEILPTQATARASLGVAPKARMALFVSHGGEEAAYKAGAHWRELWGGIKRRCPQALGFFVGGRNEKREGDLLLWPYVENEQLQLVLRAADVLVYPSLADNHPLIVLEAMSMGCAVVASAVGGIPEQINHGVTGLLAPPNDFRSLEDRVVELLDHPARARSIGATAREQGKSRFNKYRMFGGYMRCYARLAVQTRSE